MNYVTCRDQGGSQYALDVMANMSNSIAGIIQGTRHSQTQQMPLTRCTDSRTSAMSGDVEGGVAVASTVGIFSAMAEGLIKVAEVNWTKPLSLTPNHQRASRSSQIGVMHGG